MAIPHTKEVSSDWSSLKEAKMTDRFFRELLRKRHNCSLSLKAKILVPKICARVCECVCMCLYVCVRVQVCVCACVHVFVCECLYVQVCVCVSVCASMCVHECLSNFGARAFMCMSKAAFL